MGALLGKPYNFTARPWELKRTDSIDIHDALGTNVSVHSRGVEVMRIIARDNDEVNEFLISGKIHSTLFCSMVTSGFRISLGGGAHQNVCVCV